METDGLSKAIEAAALAGKLRASAEEHRRTADSLERAAERYSAKGREALAGIGAPAPGVCGDAGAGLTLGSHDQARQTRQRWGGLVAGDWEW